MNKVVLILLDGMRPDAIDGIPLVEELKKTSSYTLNAETVYPSVTLPCHMSLFHSVDPDRHGIVTNTYVPQVRPVKGMFDVFDEYGKKCAFFYTWEELRDLGRPDHLHTAVCFNQHKQSDTDIRITDAAIAYIKEEDPDFLFLYLGETDEVGGHSHGWMSPEYMQSLRKALGCIEKLYDNLPDNYTLIVLADHGGHGRGHGSEMPEDMTIPLCFCGPRFEKGKELTGLSIKDVAVTAARLLDGPPAKEWEGTARV